MGGPGGTGQGDGGTAGGTGGGNDGGSTSVSGDSGSEEGSSGGGGSESTGSAMCGPDVIDLDSAVATLVGDEPEPPDPGGGSGSGGGSGGGGPVVDPDTLRIRLSNYMTLTCGDPHGSFACNDDVAVWRLEIEVPPEMAAPGTYDLADLQVFAWTVDMCDAGGGDGVGGGGETSGGTLTIDSIGPSGISGCLDGTTFTEFDANGSFNADNCSDL